MTILRAFLIVFALFATGIPHLALASRGLYFSASKMTSSQKNTISNYSQGTVVDVQLATLPLSNTIDSTAINGKSFDFTTNDTAGDGYLSYNTLKAALNSKYMTGDVTFKVKTSALDKSVTTYTVGDGGSLTLNGANLALSGITGSSSLTTAPTTTGGSISYSLTQNGVTSNGTVTGREIVAPNSITTNYCIYDTATASEACAPMSTIKERYGSNMTSIPVKDAFNWIKEESTPTTTTRNGSNVTIYTLPDDFYSLEEGIKPFIGGYVSNDYGNTYIKVKADNIAQLTSNSSYKSYYRYNTPPADNTISTATNAANVTFGAGTIIEVANGVVNSIKSSTNGVTVSDITITGSTTTETQYACKDASRSWLTTGECDFEIAVPNIQTDTSSTYTAVNPSSNATTTLFYKVGANEYFTDKAYADPTSTARYLPTTNSTGSQADVAALTLVNGTASTITTSGISTFTNATLDTSATNANTYSSITKTGVSEVTQDTGDSGIDLYSPFMDQLSYASVSYVAIVQNLRFDPTKVGFNATFGDLYGLFAEGESSFDNNTKNAISYIDGDTTYTGQSAIDKFQNAIALTLQSDSKTQQRYASVTDITYTHEQSVNKWQEQFGVCPTGTTCGLDIMAGIDMVTNAIAEFQDLSIGAGGTANEFAQFLNNSLAASKEKNLASYQANYQKDSSGNYLLDSNGDTIKDGTYDITLKAKDWSFETQKLKDAIKLEVASGGLAPQFNTQTHMQSFVNALAGKSSDGFEMSVGYKFRLFKSSFYTAPQFDVSMFRNAQSTLSGVNQVDKTDTQTYTYGSLDSSYAGSLVAKLGFENQLNFGIFKVPFSLYGFGGATTGIMKYRNANAQSFGLKYGFGAEVFVSKNLALFGEMFQINLMKQSINYTATNSYTPSTAASDYINDQLGTSVTLDNSQYGQDTKNLSIKYADFSDVIDADKITYTTKESFENQGRISGVKFGVTYYVE